MIAAVLARVFGTRNERELRRIGPIVEKINSLEPVMQKLDADGMVAKTNEFRERCSRGESLDSLLPEAFALVRESARRVLGERHYDVQLVGGIVLHEGKIAEMRTGEGKTLVATLPLYLNALTGKGAHLVTVNDYLARRDGEWMRPVFETLGLTVGILQNDMSDEDREAAYQTDILYATNNELGFDYLRDNMKFRLSDYVQRELHYAIVDEVDSILIDEARTPLIISGATDESSKLYESTDRIIRSLIKNVDFEVDEKDRQATLTELGVDKVEHALNIQNLFAVENIKLLHHVNQALKAHALFKKDVDYIVADEQVLIVDEFTGRILSGRRYSDGLHQALEAKEGVDIQAESQTLATITLQNYFRLYKKLAGMTGTAATEGEEFYRTYKLEVVTIPTNRPIARIDQQDLVFLGRAGKYTAIVKDVAERHQKGQPILIGTVAVETSEYLSAIFTRQGIPHAVLNAKQHEREADIVAGAGQRGAVTIATNMAGRGTDIKLTDETKSCGGLYILGTERHESRRIDNQLRGRAGRQGDPGESRFYLSAEDDLLRIFGGDSFHNNLKRFGMTEDEIIEDKWFTKAIARAQEMVEKRNFEMRKNVLEYDDVLNQQRLVVYSYRRSVLEGADEIASLFRDLCADTVSDVVSAYVVRQTVSPEAYHAIALALSKLLNINPDELLQQPFNKTNVEVLKKDLLDYLLMRYDLYLNSVQGGGDEDDRAMRLSMMHEAQKWLMLESIDQAWKQHMVNLDSLREGIGLRGWGNKNPLIEYKKEAFDLFVDMMRSVRSEIVHHIFHLDLDHFNKAAIEARRIQELEEIKMAGGGDTTGQEPKLSRAERRKKPRK
ncbi:TPA: preprotein translocase subunit SecA [Candidatus Dependentiae bacterium]|nr:preprotein translocase subunit SecA [Candidatus Dependentiae bacterium]